MTAARYAGPLKLGEQGRRLVLDTLAKAQFAPEGPLSGNEYRELSVGETSDGRIPCVSRTRRTYAIASCPSGECCMNCSETSASARSVSLER